MDDGYRGPQVCKIVGITYRQLDYWARTDLIRPSIADARGCGTQRRYSYRDLIELRVIRAILDAGISLQSARRTIDYLRIHWDDNIASTHLVIIGNSTALVRSDGEILDLLRGGKATLASVLPLSLIVDELNVGIAALRVVA